ncbi:MAG: hypothetical protein K2H43_06585 [Clostridia bacterium]|nr:hypothetical protein [Clostridia bacterium]
MEIFNKIVEFVQTLPEWVAWLACPAFLVVVALLLTLCGGRKAYWGLSAIACGAGFFLVACREGADIGFLYLALAVVLCGVLRLLLFLPRIGGKRGEKKYTSREEQMYEKFREPLSVPFEDSVPPWTAYPAEPAAVTAEEYGMQLDYVSGLLGKLKAERLTAADRLETEVLARAIDSYRGKPLTERELGSLNDCLASVLKMTAKYKL